MLKVIIGYPTLEEEKLIIRSNISGEQPAVRPVTTAEEILKARKIVNEVYLDEKSNNILQTLFLLQDIQTVTDCRS